MTAANQSTSTNGSKSSNPKCGGEGEMAPADAPKKQALSSKIWKGRDGFEAESVFSLDQGTHRVLIVSTCKTQGGMTSRFCVQVDKSDGFRSWDIFGDYNQRIEFKGTRCTEKTVRELHAQALHFVDQHLTQAAAHYAKKTADCTARA